MGKDDHIGRGADRDEADQGDHPDGLGIDMAETQPQGPKDQGKLTDLRHGQPGQKAGAFTVTNAPMMIITISGLPISTNSENTKDAYSGDGERSFRGT